MTLSAYLETHGITVPAFADSIGATVSGVTKWRRCERFPSARWMRRISAATGGAVQPNDFAFDPILVSREEA